MDLIEIAHPDRALTTDDRTLVAEAIVDALVRNPAGSHAAPEETMRRARMTTHVGFRPMLGWTTGDGPWREGTPPPLWITLTTPEAWREEIAPTLIGLVRTAVQRLDDERGWQRTGGDLWINVVGLADGSIGLGGRSTTADGVVAYLTEEFRATYDPDAADLPAGVVIDPMCGMQVKLGKGAITLEHDGETLGFCALACRAAYARQHGLEASA